MTLEEMYLEIPDQVTDDDGDTWTKADDGLFSLGFVPREMGYTSLGYIQRTFGLSDLTD